MLLLGPPLAQSTANYQVNLHITHDNNPLPPFSLSPKENKTLTPHMNQQ